MTQIYPHPDIEDHFEEVDCSALARDRDALLSAYAAERVVLLRNTRLEADLEFLRTIAFPQTWKYKKLPASLLEKGPPGIRAFERRAALRAEHDEFRQRVCGGDARKFRRFMRTFETVNGQLRSLMGDILRNRVIRKGSVIWRFAETRGENLHFDNEAGCDQEESFRLYWNVDDAPRVWHTSEGFSRLAPAYYRDLDLAGFRDRPTERMLNEMSVRLFGGWQNRGREQFPRHMILLEPGDIWLSDGRTVPHQVIYGRRVVMARFVVEPDSLPQGYPRLRDKVARLHAAANDATSRPPHLPPPFPPGGVPRPEGEAPADLKADWERLHAESVGEGLRRV